MIYSDLGIITNQPTPFYYYTNFRNFVLQNSGGNKVEKRLLSIKSRPLNKYSFIYTFKKYYRVNKVKMLILTAWRLSLPIKYYYAFDSIFGKINPVAFSDIKSNTRLFIFNFNDFSSLVRNPTSFRTRLKHTFFIPVYLLGQRQDSYELHYPILKYMNNIPLIRISDYHYVIGLVNLYD